MFLPLIVVKGEFSQKLWMAKNFNSRISTKKTHNEIQNGYLYQIFVGNMYGYWVEVKVRGTVKPVEGYSKAMLSGIQNLVALLFNFRLSFLSFGPMPFCMYYGISVIQLSWLSIIMTNLGIWIVWKITFFIPTFSSMLDNIKSKYTLAFFSFGM